MTDRHSEHSHDVPRDGRGSRRSLSRTELLELLRREGPSTVSTLASCTGLHVNTVRDHLARLLADGRVVASTERPLGRGRPGKVYRLATPAESDRSEPKQALPRAAFTRQAVLDRLLAGYGSDAGSVTDAAIEDGTRIARSQPLPPVSTRDPQRRQLNVLLAQMEDAGFAPRADADELTVDLWDCPVRDLAAGRPEVVCAMHLGLEREALRRAGGSLTAERLCPFVGPRLCRLHLRKADASDRS